MLLIDADPQGSLTISLGYEEPDEMEYSLATLMLNVVNDEKLNMEKTILHHGEGVDLIPANIELSAIEVSLVNAMSRELILRSLVDKLREFYDFILIDCMPSLGMMTINALACADSVLIPVQAAYLPVKGLFHAGSSATLSTSFTVTRSLVMQASTKTIFSLPPKRAMMRSAWESFFSLLPVCVLP